MNGFRAARSSSFLAAILFVRALTGQSVAAEETAAVETNRADLSPGVFIILPRRDTPSVHKFRPAPPPGEINSRFLQVRAPSFETAPVTGEKRVEAKSGRYPFGGEVIILSPVNDDWGEESGRDTNVERLWRPAVFNVLPAGEAQGRALDDYEERRPTRLDREEIRTLIQLLETRIRMFRTAEEPEVERKKRDLVELSGILDEKLETLTKNGRVGGPPIEGDEGVAVSETVTVRNDRVKSPPQETPPARPALIEERYRESEYLSEWRPATFDLHGDTGEEDPIAVPAPVADPIETRVVGLFVPVPVETRVVEVIETRVVYVKAERPIETRVVGVFVPVPVETRVVEVIETKVVEVIETKVVEVIETRVVEVIETRVVSPAIAPAVETMVGVVYETGIVSEFESGVPETKVILVWDTRVVFETQVVHETRITLVEVKAPIETVVRYVTETRIVESYETKTVVVVPTRDTRIIGAVTAEFLALADSFRIVLGPAELLPLFDSLYRVMSVADESEAADPEGQRLALPEGAARLYAAAEQLVDDGDLEGAAGAFEKFIDLYPFHPLVPAARMGLVWCHIYLKRPQQALDELLQVEASVAAERIQDFMIYSRGICFQELRKFDEAIAEFNRIIEDYPTSPFFEGAEARSLLSLVELERYGEAAGILARITARTAEPPVMAIAARFRIAMNTRDYEEAFDDVRSLVNVLPIEEAEEYVFALAELEELFGRNNTSTMKMYLSRYPEGPHAAQFHRQLSEMESDTRIKIVHLRSAIALGDIEPYASEIRENLAHLLEEIGDTEFAERLRWSAPWSAQRIDPFYRRVREFGLTRETVPKMGLLDSQVVIRYAIMTSSIDQELQAKQLELADFTNEKLARYWPRWVPSVSAEAQYLEYHGHNAIVVNVLIGYSTNREEPGKLTIFGQTLGDLIHPDIMMDLGESGELEGYEENLKEFVEIVTRAIISEDVTRRTTPEP